MDIRKLIDNEKKEFKDKYGLKLTFEMISNISWIRYDTLIKLYYEWQSKYLARTYREYCERLKVVDFSKFINKKFLKLK